LDEKFEPTDMKTQNHRTVLKIISCLIAAVTLVSRQSAFAALGEFETNSDVGNPAKAGSASYDPAHNL